MPLLLFLSLLCFAVAALSLHWLFVNFVALGLFFFVLSASHLTRDPNVDSMIVWLCLVGVLIIAAILRRPPRADKTQ